MIKGVICGVLNLALVALILFIIAVAYVTDSLYYLLCGLIPALTASIYSLKSKKKK